MHKQFVLRVSDLTRCSDDSCSPYALTRNVTDAQLTILETSRPICCLSKTSVYGERDAMVMACWSQPDWQAVRVKSRQAAHCGNAPLVFASELKHYNVMHTSKSHIKR